MPTSNPNRNTFPKSEKLVSKNEFEKLMDEGSSFTAFPLKVKYLVGNDKTFQSPAQFAVSVPKRLFKRAVDRNLLKRRIREAYRLSKSDLYHHLGNSDMQVSILIVYIGKEVADYSRINGSCNAIIKHLINEI